MPAFGPGFMNTLGTIGGAVLAGGVPIIGPALAGAFIANRAGAGKRASASAAPPVAGGDQTFAAQDAQTGKGGAIKLTGAVTAQQLQAQRDWAQRELDLDEQRLDAIEAQLQGMAQAAAQAQQQAQQQAMYAAWMSAQAQGGGLFGGGGGGGMNSILPFLLISGGLGSSSSTLDTTTLVLIMMMSQQGGGGWSNMLPLLLLG